MSHVKNAGSYSRLVDICTGLGGKYNPGRQTLQLKAMRALLAEVQSSLQDVSQKRNALSAIVNERAKTFAALAHLTSQITLTLQASQISGETLANARYYTRLINGRLKSDNDRLPIASEDSEEKSLSTRAIRQQSYVAQAYNFMRLAQLVSEVPGYETAIDYLQPQALMEKANELRALNESWSQAKVALSHARMHRDNLFYKGQDSLLSNAAAVKSYLRVAFGSRSKQADELSELSFTKLKIR